MIRKELYADWVVLIGVGILLIFMYGFNIKELVKRLLEWTFAVIGFKLLIDYGALPTLRERIIKNESKNNMFGDDVR